MSNTLNLAELNEEFESDKKSSEGGGKDFLENFVLMPEGDGVLQLRILPPGNDLPMLHGGLCMSTRIHTINGRKVHCRKEKVKGKKYPEGDCRICDHYNWLYRQADALKARGDREGSESAIREARSIKPVERFYFNAIVRKVRKENGEDLKDVGPLIYSAGKTIKDRILRAILGDESLEEAPLGDITHPLNGRDFKIVKEMRHSNGESFPNYDKSKFLEPSPLGNPDQVKKWMANLHDLHGLRHVKTVEEVERELRVHLGSEEDTKPNAYDPKNYQRSTNTVVSSPATSAVTSTHEVDDEPRRSVHVEESVAMSDDDFFKTLQSM